MINELEITNFQSHQYSLLEFAPGVNVIKGTSHHGKSAIIRALKWVLFNRPRGEGFKSHFADDKDPVEVAISFSDDVWISRRRDNDNRYYSDDLNLKALRTDVPDEVKAITRIGEINFQGQDDKYFLIEDSPGVAGKKLNEIIGLQIIDEVREKINRKINKLTLESNIVEDDLKTTEEQLKKYKHVEKAERLVGRIQSLTNKHDEYKLRSHKIKQIVDMIQANEKLGKDLLLWLMVEKHYFLVLSMHHQLKEMKERKDSIFWIVEEIENRKVILDEMNEIIALEPDLKMLKKKQKSVSDKLKTISKLSYVCATIHKLEKTRRNAQETLEIDLKRKAELEKQLNFCQYCGANKKYWRK